MPKIPIYIYEVIARKLKKFGIHNVSTLISDDIAHLVCAIEDLGIRNYRTRHENYAIAMAEGFAAATDKVGVALVGYGPGLANAIHGLVYAKKTHSPVLIITGDDPFCESEGYNFKPEYKAINTKGLLQSLEVLSFTPENPDDVLSTLIRAYSKALEGNTVVFTLPKGIQFYTTNKNIESKPKNRLVKLKTDLGLNNVEKVIEIVSDSTKPIILAGLGAYRAGAKANLLLLADRIGALVGTSLKANSLFLSHRYNIGIVGGFSHGCAKKYLQQADCVLVFGASLNFWTTYNDQLFPAAKIIQIDHAPESIGRFYRTDASIVADANDCSKFMLENIPSNKNKFFHQDHVLEDIQSYQIKDNFINESIPGKLDPRVVALELTRTVSRDVFYVCDTGNFLSIVPYLKPKSPRHFKVCSDFHSIGIGIGVAMGFASAHPEHLTIYFVGDGAMMMQLGELETIVRENLPVVVFVMNDSAYGAELHFLKIKNKSVSPTTFEDVNFFEIAKGMGMSSYRVSTLQHLKNCAKHIRNIKKPLLIDCRINQDIQSPMFKFYFS